MRIPGLLETDKDAIRSLEQQLMERSDCVFVFLRRTLEYEAVATIEIPFLVTHGVDVFAFPEKRVKRPQWFPTKIRPLKKPVIGFFRFDRRLGRSGSHTIFWPPLKPDWNLVLIGKVVTSLAAIDGLPNVHLFGQKALRIVARLCKKHSTSH